MGGKLGARDGGAFCQEKKAPLRLNPTVFDINVPSSEFEDEKASEIPIISDKYQKCDPGYPYNLCCDGLASGWSGVENNFRMEQCHGLLSK